MCAHRASSMILASLAVTMLLSAASCQQAQQSSAERSKAAVQPAAEAAPPRARLDQVTTLETLFADASDRSLYEAHPEVREQGTLAYSFALRAQPGMESPRHFRIVTVVWSPASSASTPGSSGQATSSTGGPGGSLVEHTATTADGLFTVRVSLGELLPDSVRANRVDIVQLSERLVSAYGALETRPPQ